MILPPVIRGYKTVAGMLTAPESWNTYDILLAIPAKQTAARTVGSR